MEPFEAIDYEPINKQIIEFTHEQILQAFDDISIDISFRNNSIAVSGGEHITNSGEYYIKKFTIDEFLDSFIEYHTSQEDDPDEAINILNTLKAVIDGKINKINASNQSKQS